MRKTIKPVLTLFVCAICLGGCFKDTVVEQYSFFRPVYKTRAEVRAAIRSAQPQSIENPGKLFVKGNYVYLNEVDKGIHIIDYSDPSSPKNVSFIAIPGNADIAVNGNYLYADCYSDLVTLDISNPANVIAVNFDDKVFPQRYWVPDTSLVIAGWVKVDTMIRREDRRRNISILLASSFGGPAMSASAPASQGKAGSMSRFGLMNNRLYTVSSSDLKVFNLSNAADPVFTKTVFPGSGTIETIYPFNNSLFLGSMNGMFIMSVANPDNPVRTGVFVHATACDPVITDGTYAYVTLRAGTRCSGVLNQMDVVNVTNLSSPSFVKTYQFNNPQGLDKDGDLIFLCDGSAGLRVLNAQNVNDIRPVKTFAEMNAYDVVAINKLAITVAKDGLYFINYADPANIRVLSKISIAVQ